MLIAYMFCQAFDLSAHETDIHLVFVLLPAVLNFCLPSSTANWREKMASITILSNMVALHSLPGVSSTAGVAITGAPARYSAGFDVLIGRARIGSGLLDLAEHGLLGESPQTWSQNTLAIHQRIMPGTILPSLCALRITE